MISHAMMKVTSQVAAKKMIDLWGALNGNPLVEHTYLFKQGTMVRVFDFVESQIQIVALKGYEVNAWYIHKGCDWDHHFLGDQPFNLITQVIHKGL